MNGKNPAPIVLFTYKRLDTLKLVIDALTENYLAPFSDLHIFSDAAKGEFDRDQVSQVRSYLHRISGFKNVYIYESKINKGLATSVIDGVTQIINSYGKVIVLEDDLVVSCNFLDFMNQGLTFYEDNKRIFSISGYTKPIKGTKDDIYCTLRGSSWGWATWKDRWQDLDWQIKYYEEWKRNYFNRLKYNRMGSDMSKLLNDQMNGKIDSWLVRWNFNQFLRQQSTIYPTLSKVQNIGTGKDATHTKDNFKRFETILDPGKRRDFNFKEDIKMEAFYLNQFLKQYSIMVRVKYKILNFLLRNSQI